MGHWLATVADKQRTDWVKRFDARFWTVDFPQPMLASVTTTGARSLRVDCAFARANDLAGLIWASADVHDHPLLGYATARDYRGCVLAFRWVAAGVKALDAVNGPVLTIEGRDAGGAARAWYVRLWNYAAGTPGDAAVRLDFDALDGGFLLPGEADRVWAGDIDRMFVSLVPAGYDGSAAPLQEAGVVEVSAIVCDGPGSVLALGDAFVPPHRMRIASGYDDNYHLTPARLVRNWVQLGYSGVVDHYVGMSHFPALGPDGLAGGGIAVPARAWHADLLARCAEAGIEVIVSLSFELFDSLCPAGWAQRDADGARAATGYAPPSTLLSPCSAGAMAWVQGVAAAFAGLAAAAGQRVRFQIGEPWWWVGANQRLCAYDGATRAAYLGETGLVAPEIRDVRGMSTAVKRAFLDWLGAKLGAATLAVRDAVLAAAGGAETLLLFYAPQVLRGDAPDLARANLPVAAWASPAFEVLQLEDYDFVTGGDFAGQARTRAVAETLGYPLARQHYLAGFAAGAGDWPRIVAAAAAARARGIAEVFLWAWPQIARDGLTFFEMAGDETMPAFHDVRFPLALGYGATGGPQFSTQVVTSASGYEQRNSGWADARLHYDAGVGVRSEDDLAELIAFFRARRGQAHGFRFEDPMDHAGANEPIGFGDGVTTRFGLTRTYGVGEDAQVRRITRPVAGSVAVTVGGAAAVGGWSLGELGFVDFAVAPPVGAALAASFAFDVPVRFAEDRIDVGLAGWRAGDVPSVPLIEVREL